MTVGEILWRVAGMVLDRKPLDGEAPDEAALCDWWPECPLEAREEATARTRELHWLFEVAEWGTFGLSVQYGGAIVNSLPNPGPMAIVWEKRPNGRDGRPQVVLSDIAIVHQAWLDLPEADRAPHPLAPIVKAWLERPRKVLRNPHRNRIVPSRVAMVNGEDKRAGKLFSPAAHVGESNGKQIALLGFGDGEEYGRRMPVLPLMLYRLGMDRQHGAGAPLPLRLFVDSVRCVRVGTDYPVYMDTTLREIMLALWPSAREGKLRPAEYLGKLEKAAKALDSWDARFPWFDPATGKGGLRKVVTVSDFPRGETYLDDVFAVTVHLPPDSREGPALPPADVLNAWGAHSALAYIGIINLAFEWFQPGINRIPVKRGGRGKHWLQSQDPASYLDLTDEDLLDVFMPVRDARPVRRNALARIHDTIALLEAHGGLRKHGLKLLPPALGTELRPPPSRRKPSRIAS